MNTCQQSLSRAMQIALVGWMVAMPLAGLAAAQDQDDPLSSNEVLNSIVWLPVRD